MQQKFLKNNLNTFSAIYGKGIRGDESNYINLYKTKIKNMFFAKPTDISLFNDLDNFISSYVEPLNTTSYYAQYKVMEIAKENKCTVLLNGQIC